MKSIILTIICVLTLLTSGCRNFMFSHNANQFVNGEYVRVGFGDYGLTFGSGTMLTLAVRENTEIKVDMQNGNDFTGAPTTKMDSVKSLSFRTGPQVTGYLVDLAEKSPDAATAYVGEMPDINKASWDTKQVTQSKSSGEKSSSDNYIDYLKAKLGSLVGKDKEVKATISGDGDYKDLWKDNSISAQAALTAELLAICDDTTDMPTSGETIKDALVHYAGRLAQLKAKGKTDATKILLDRCTVKDAQLTYLMFRLTENGKVTDEECPSCYELED